MRRIRVLEFTAGLAIGEQLGGAELFAAQLARHLNKSEFESAVFGLWQYGSQREKSWVSTLRSEGICVNLLATPTNHVVVDLRQAFSAFWAAVDDFKPDIINSHSERTDVFNLLVHILHPTHPVSVRTMHTDEQWQNRPKVGAIFINMVFPFTFETEIAISEAVRQVLDNRFIARRKNKKSILCYNGIDAAILHREATEGKIPCPNGVPDQSPRIGVIGRLTQQKGHTDLVKAMKIVLETRPVHLLIIGSGPLEASLKQQVACSRIQNFVHFLGSRSDVLEILHCLDLVVSPSLWEGFPTVLLEAMASEVPVVATDVSGSRELVKTGETGLLVAPQAPACLAKAVLEMLGNPSKARLMAENAKRLMTQFTIQNAATRYAQIYKQITLTRITRNQT